MEKELERIRHMTGQLSDKTLSSSNAFGFFVCHTRPIRSQDVPHITHYYSYFVCKKTHCGRKLSWFVILWLDPSDPKTKSRFRA